MNEPFDTLMDALEVEECKVRQKLSTDSAGLFPVYALREYDSFFLNYKENQGKDFSGDFIELHYLLRLGLPRALSIALSCHKSYTVPTIMPVHNEALASRARATILRLGIIEHGRRLAIASKIGDLELSQNSESSFSFVLPKTWVDYDAYEEAVERHFREQGLAIYQNAYQALESTKGLEKELSELARDRVFAYRKYFIGYEAHPTIDDHFFGLAYFYVSTSSAFDTFKFNLKFGGVTFSKYVLAVVYIYSLALKHELFCRELLAKSPDTNQRNILTISSDKEGFIEDMGHALDMYGPSFSGFTFTTRSELETIYNVLSVRRENIELLKPNGAPAPMLFEFSDTSVYRSIAGAQEQPLQILLNGLRHHFPKDYDRNQQTREHSFQSATERVLRSCVSGVKFKRNVKLKADGKELTDIDLSAADNKSNTIVLVQLKSQDSFGSEVNARINRSRRFVAECEKWIKATQNWLSQASDHEIRNKFGLPEESSKPKIYLLVLSKNFAHFGFELENAENVTFCTWFQFNNAVAKLKSRHGQLRTLEALFGWIVRDEIRRNVQSTEWSERQFELDSIQFFTVNED